MSKVLLDKDENLYFDSVNGRFLEMLDASSFDANGDRRTGDSFGTFGALKKPTNIPVNRDESRFMDVVTFPAVISCGDPRAHGKTVQSIEEIQLLFQANEVGNNAKS